MLTRDLARPKNFNFFWFFLFSFSIIGLSLIGSASAVTTIIGNETGGQSVINDTYACTGCGLPEGDQTKGKDTFLQVRNHIIDLANARTYIKVNFSSIGTITAITNATLYLTEDDGFGSGAGSVVLYNISNQGAVNGFSEYKPTGNISYNNQPCGSGTFFNSSCNTTVQASQAVADGQGTYGWDVTAIAQSVMSSTKAFAVVMNSTNPLANEQQFESKESVSAQNFHPFLLITYSAESPTGNSLTLRDSSISPSTVTYDTLQNPLSLSIVVTNATTNSTVGTVTASIFGTNRTLSLTTPFTNSSGGGIFSLDTTWLTNVTAGSSTIKFYAVETVGGSTFTDVSQDQTLTINKGSPVSRLHRLIDGATSDKEITLPTTANVTGFFDIQGSSDLSFSIFRINTTSSIVDNGNPTSHITTGYRNGTYQFIYGTLAGGANWTSGNTSAVLLTIHSAGAVISTISSPTNTTYSTHTIEFNFKATSGSSSTFTLTAYDNGTTFYSSSGYPNNTVISNITTKGNGTHNLTVVATDSLGSSTSTVIYTVSVAPSIPPSSGGTGLSGFSSLIAGIIIIILAIFGIFLVKRELEGERKIEKLVMIIVSLVILMSFIAILTTLV